MSMMQHSLYAYLHALSENCVAIAAMSPDLNVDADATAARIQNNTDVMCRISSQAMLFVHGVAEFDFESTNQLFTRQHVLHSKHVAIVNKQISKRNTQSNNRAKRTSDMPARDPI